MEGMIRVLQREREREGEREREARENTPDCWLEQDTSFPEDIWAQKKKTSLPGAH